MTPMWLSRHMTLSSLMPEQDAMFTSFWGLWGNNLNNQQQPTNNNNNLGTTCRLKGHGVTLWPRAACFCACAWVFSPTFRLLRVDFGLFTMFLLPVFLRHIRPTAAASETACSDWPLELHRKRQSQYEPTSIRSSDASHLTVIQDTKTYKMRINKMD